MGIIDSIQQLDADYRDRTKDIDWTEPEAPGGRPVTNSDECAVYGCKEKAKSRGLCQKHYLRFRALEIVDDAEEFAALTNRAQMGMNELLRASVEAVMRVHDAAEDGVYNPSINYLMRSG